MSQPETKESSSACKRVQRSSRKGMSWSAEEKDLLVNPRKDEDRPRSQVADLFSRQ
ncbi:hypothetical protein BDV12DRAFT_181316 [Aspergillus spectabilis]